MTLKTNTYQIITLNNKPHQRNDTKHKILPDNDPKQQISPKE